MPRVAKPLSNVELKRLPPGTHAVGGVPGLLVVVRDTGTRHWILRVTIAGKRREIGLGSFPETSLADARDRAKADRVAVRDGRDPASERASARAALAETRRHQVTVTEAIDKTYEARKAGFKTEKGARRWRMSLVNHIGATLGDRALVDVTSADIAAILAPMWLTQNDTASKVRLRMEAVFDFAIAKGLVPAGTANPAVLKGSLKPLLPSAKRVQGGAQPAVDWKAAPTWWKAVSSRSDTAALALRFIALTAVRSSEATKMAWDEVDLDAGRWIVPAERTKTGKPLTVPLSGAAIAVLRQVLPLRQEGVPWVFAGVRGGPLGGARVSELMREVHDAYVARGGVGWVDASSGRPGVVHGLRSTFRTWATEHRVDENLAEIALGHARGSKVERAYDRAEMIEARRVVMESWSRHLAGS